MKIDAFLSKFFEPIGNKLCEHITEEQADAGMIICFVVMIVAVIGMMFAWGACFNHNVEEMRRRTKKLQEDYWDRDVL